MWKAFLDTLPRGYALEEQEWRRRHQVPVKLLTAHIPALALIGGLLGRGLLALVAAVAVPAACAVLGHLLRHHRRAAAVSVTLGLVWCSAALVGLTGGAIEAHFHFFIIIGFIALYQDWIPFLFMILFTTVSHVLGSTWQRDLMFDHAAGQANPWLWSLIHGVAVLAACIGIVMFWHVTEDVQEKNVLARRLADAEASRRRFTSDLLVNLARRNQSMLHRQLEIINQLEESERDPDTLAELFTLDHLTTRVRRNAESLLVLSGEQPSRIWSEPVPIRDVLRAAIAETEDLDRVVFVADEHVAVAGHTVTDLTHLIAELTENAVRFSPPDSTVSVRARANRQQPGGQVLTVEDWGVGMPPTQLTAANVLLARPPEVDLSVSQRLGFHVVARLAARHGITASLHATPGSGVTATIVLPPALFAGPAQPDVESAADDAPAGGVQLAGASPAAEPVAEPAVEPADEAAHTGHFPVPGPDRQVTADAPIVIMGGRRVEAGALDPERARPLGDARHSAEPVSAAADPVDVVPTAEVASTDQCPTIGLPTVRFSAVATSGGAGIEDAAPRDRPRSEPTLDHSDQDWRGWWAADVDSATADQSAHSFGPLPFERRAVEPVPVADAPRSDQPTGSEAAAMVPSPRPRASSAVAVPAASVPAAQSAAPREPRPDAVPPPEPPVDPVSGLRKRTPQAHLAPELRRPLNTPEPAGVGLPQRSLEAAQALSRYQAIRAAARTSTANEHGWLS